LEKFEVGKVRSWISSMLEKFKVGKLTKLTKSIYLRKKTCQYNLKNSSRISGVI